MDIFFVFLSLFLFIIFTCFFTDSVNGMLFPLYGEEYVPGDCIISWSQFHLNRHSEDEVKMKKCYVVASLKRLSLEKIEGKNQKHLFWSNSRTLENSSYIIEYFLCFGIIN